MSEGIKLEFSPPEPLIDPSTKSNPLEWVFHSAGRLKQLALNILSPSEEAIVQFTKFFIAEVESEKIIIKRVTADEEVDDDLANANLIMNISMLASDRPVVVELDIDPPINAGFSHVYTFASRGERDFIEISVNLKPIECALIDSSQMGRLLRNFSGGASLKVSQPGVTGETFVTQSEISKTLAEISVSPLNKKVKMVSGENEKTNLSNGQIDEYALIIKGAGDVAKKEKSTYTLQGRIRLDEKIQV